LNDRAEDYGSSMAATTDDHVEVPQQSAADRKVPGTPKVGSEALRPSPNAKVLVVDDEKSIRLTMGHFLSAGGYQVETAETVDAAKTMIRENAFDVVVSDIVLPGVSGVELLQFVRETAPAVQVIMMTGQPDLETAAATVRLAASDYLAKPVTKNALLRSVANATRVKKMEDERRALIETLRTKYTELEVLAHKRKVLLHLLHHDVSNALSGAIANLEREKHTIEQYTFCEESLLDMLTHCQSVIRDVRDRDAEAPHASEPEPTDLRTLVEEACDTLSAKTAGKQVEVRIDIAPGISVLARPGPFVVHVLNNILSNAIKFSYPGATIDIAAAIEDSWTSISFRDHGCGIPKHRLTHLLDSPSSTPGTAGEPGTGYGLRHTRQAVEELGGSLVIVSTCEDEARRGTDSAGTTVTIRIKRVPSPDVSSVTSRSDNDAAGHQQQAPVEIILQDKRAEGKGATSGIIVIDDAWPVTDAICFALADMLPKRRPWERYRIVYARMQELPPRQVSTLVGPAIEFVSIPGGSSADEKNGQLDAAIGPDPDGVVPVLVLQERKAIGLFYARLADPVFRKAIVSRFGLFASDYALGLPFSGTDVLRCVGSGIRRVLISANAVEHLPPDYKECCEARIDKSSVKITTLVSRFLD